MTTAQPDRLEGDTGTDETRIVLQTGENGKQSLCQTGEQNMWE